jgi:hypothetical protein
MTESISEADIFAIDIALESERSGVAIERLAQGDDQIIAVAKQLRTILAGVRHELLAQAAEQGRAPDEADAAFRAIVAAKLGPRGREH